MKAEYRRVEKIVVIFCFLVSLFSACNPQPAAARTESEPVVTATERVVQTTNPIPAIEATPTQKLEPLEMKFGAGVEDFRIVKSRDVNDIIKYMASSQSEYPYQYIIYTDKKEFGSLNWSAQYKPSKTGLDFMEKFKDFGINLTISEPDIFEEVLKSRYYSEYSIGSTHQKVILVTEETGDDGITRNGFFSYSESGIAIYIDASGIIRIYNGNNIDIDDPEVRSLFEQGYTQVRIVNGQPKGFFNINNLPSRILANMK